LYTDGEDSQPGYGRIKGEPIGVKHDAFRKSGDAGSTCRADVADDSQRRWNDEPGRDYTHEIDV